MSVRNLDKLFKLRAVALIDATPPRGSLGAVLARNLTRGGFGGRLMPVNLRHPRRVRDYRRARRLQGLPVTERTAFRAGVICVAGRLASGFIVPLVLAELRACGDVEVEVPEATRSTGVEIQSGAIAGQRRTSFLEFGVDHGSQVYRYRPRILGVLPRGNPKIL